MVILTKNCWDNQIRITKHCPSEPSNAVLVCLYLSEKVGGESPGKMGIVEQQKGTQGCEVVQKTPLY